MTIVRDTHHTARTLTLVTLALSAALAILACNPAREAQRGAESDGGTQGSSVGTNRPSEGESRPESDSRWEARTVAAGTSFAARLDTTLDSSTSVEGDSVQATLMSDLRDAVGNVVLPSGTKLLGRVTEVVSARKVQKKSSLAFRFDRATLSDGTETDLSASEGFDGKGWTKKQGGIIGGSAAGGAVLGQVLGNDTKSTVEGAIVGGAIAAGIIMSHKGEDIVLSSGSTMELTLDADVVVKRASAS